MAWLNQHWPRPNATASAMPHPSENANPAIAPQQPDDAYIWHRLGVFSGCGAVR
jgi:hypothetical protein